MCDKHGLVNGVVSDALYLLIVSKSLYTKNGNKGNDSLFINTELRNEIFDALDKTSEDSGSEIISRDDHSWEENPDSRLPLHEVIV